MNKHLLKFILGFILLVIGFLFINIFYRTPLIFLGDFISLIGGIIMGKEVQKLMI